MMAGVDLSGELFCEKNRATACAAVNVTVEQKSLAQREAAG